MIDDDIRALREAIAAGPTLGPWTSMHACIGEQCVARLNNHEVFPPKGVDLAHESIDARYIAAASPDRIASLLDEVERLRAFERGVIEAIPGPRYMDPPDGGDVTPLEQVRRMVAEVERLRAALEVSSAATAAAVSKARWQASTNEELNRLSAQANYLRAATLAPNAAREDMLEAARYLRQCAEAEPVAWLYANIAGILITHYADKLDAKQLVNDVKAAREYPNAHKVTPLYTHPQPQQAGVPGRWVDIVEQRLLTWRQRFTNRSGDQLALDDFMDQQSIDDLVDFVCDEHAAPQPPSAQAEPTIDINIKIAVPANWSNRLDMQWIVEREIHADRWSWSYAAPQAMNTQADAIEALRRVIEAANGRQRHNPITDEMNAALRYARTVLAAHGGKDE